MMRSPFPSWTLKQVRIPHRNLRGAGASLAPPHEHCCTRPSAATQELAGREVLERLGVSVAPG